MIKQRTILRENTIHGKSLHTGDEVKLTIKPAPENHGVVFRRTDIYGKPEIKPSSELVTDLVRNTTITSGYTSIHTIEHVLSALSGCGVDNAIVEMDASEPPILDGSAQKFVNLIQEAEPVDQEAERQYFTLTEPISVTDGNRSIIALPYDGLKITCTSADDRGIHTQHFSIDINPESFMAEIAPARTFTIYEDIEELLRQGKIRGGSLDSAIVIRDGKIMSKEPLRFKEEFVRHKILDIVGDITLLGMPLKAHIIAVRPGHALNAMLTKKLRQKFDEQKTGRKKQTQPTPAAITNGEDSLDIKQILERIPHRYPFVMIDRVLEFRGDNELTAIKNVTINEPYFQGHYPGLPVMPGVLQIEAMAQAAGLLLLRIVKNSTKTPFFMSCDKVKFRRAVTPGDQLVIDVVLIKNRGNKIGIAEAKCKVGGQLVSSAELMFTLLGED